MAAHPRRRSASNAARLGVLALETRLAPSAVQDRGAAPEVYLLDDNGRPRQTVPAYPSGFAGGVWVSSADVTGDGTPDLVSAPGPGGGPQVKVFDGATGQVVRDFMAYEPAFAGGIYAVAADFTGDGRAEIVTGTDQGGGPRVRVLDGASGAALADFLAIDDANFRGGVRVSVGDVNADGTPDLVVSAGFGGGPRIAGFDGAALARGAVARLFSDFFAFEPALRNGAYPAVGDLNGDGYGDLIFGGGPGGAPRVVSFDGRAMLGGRPEMGLNFFAGDVNGRDGVRVSGVSVGGARAGVLTAGGSGGPAFLYDGGGALLGLVGREVAFNGGLFDDASGRDLRTMLVGPSPPVPPAPPDTLAALEINFADGGILRGGRPITGRVTNRGELGALEARLDGGGPVPVAVDASGGFSYFPDLPLDESGEGFHSVLFVIAHASGYTSGLSGVSFLLDTQPPALHLYTQPGQVFTDLPRVAGHIFDFSGVASFTAQVDGGPAFAVAVDQQGEFDFSTGLLPDGTHEGPHTVRLRATDALGHAVTYPDVAFTLRAVDDLGVQTVRVPTFSGQWAPAGPAELRVSLDGGPEVVVPTDAAGRYSYKPPLPLDGASGPHTVNLTAYDATGRPFYWDLNTFVLDIIAPTVDDISPPSKFPPTVTVLVASEEGAPEPSLTATVRLDSGPEVAIPTEPDSLSYTPVLPLDGSADGPHELLLNGFLDTDYVFFRTLYRFVLDTRPPTVEADPLVRGAEVRGTVRDALSRPERLWAAVDGGPEVFVPVDPDTGSFALPSGLALDGSADGPHTLSLEATDEAENTSPVLTRTFVLDTQAPAVAVTGLAVGTAATVAGVATDAGTGVQSVFARVDGGPPVAAAFDPVTRKFQLATGLPAGGSADGPHTVVVQATDGAGRTSAPVVFTFTLDTVPAPFADPDLARAAAAALGIPDGRTPSRTELLALTELAADSNLVTSLGGLEFATNLRSFTLRPGDAAVPGGLVGLAPLAGLTSLTSLSLVNAGVTAAQLPALAGLSALRDLDLRYNPVASVAAVAALPALETLRLHGSAVADLSPLAGRPVHTDREPVGAENAWTVPDLARALDYSPLRALEFVTNTVELQFYPGHLKGARATIETRAGNDWDQANLLAELLRASGVRVRFVTGVIEAPVAEVMAWLGATTQNGASSILATVGLHPEYVFAGPELMLRFDHAWVQAEFPAAGGGTRWVDLDPSWKFKTYRAARPDMLGPVPFAEAAYLAAPRAEGAVEFYAGQVAAYLAATNPGVSLADVPYDGPIRPQRFTSLPADRPYAVSGSLTTTDAVPAEQEWGARVTLSLGSTTLFSHPLVLPEMSLDRVVVEYAPAGGGQLTPLLLVGGAVVAQGPAVSAGAAVTLTVGQTQPGAPAREFEYDRRAGQFVAVGLNGLQVSDRLLAREWDAIAAAAADARAGRPVDPDEQVGAVLALAMARWYDQTGRAEETMNGLTGAVSVYAGNMSQGVATSESTVTYHWDLPIPAVPDGAGVDIPSYYKNALARDGDNSTREARRRVTGYNGSAEESAVWEALLNTPSVSTVKSLQLAAARGVPVYDITPATQGTYLPLLNLDPATEAAVAAELAAGAAVTVPRDPTPLDDWTGVGYLARRADGTVAYIISGGLHGAAPVPTAGGYSGGRPGPGTRPGGDNPFAYTTVGDPVDVSNGAVTRDETDVVLPGAGLPLAFARRYNSQVTRDAGMGPGWSFTFGDALAFNPDGSVSWTDGAGARNTFTPNGAGGFTLPVTLYGSFVAAGGGYTYTDAHGLVRRFDAAGRLQFVRDRNGNELDVGRDGAGRVSAVWEANAPARRLTFAYSGGLLASVTDHTGRAWRYFYTDGRLTRAEAPADAATPAAVVRYDYHAEPLWAGLLAAVTEPNGGRTTFAYTADGRARRVTDAAGNGVTYAYNLFRRRTDYADERGHVTTYTTNAVGNVVARTDPDGARHAWTWADNLMTAATDPFGAVTTYQYDARGNLTRVTDPAGRVTATTYDPVYSRPTSVTLPGGRVTTSILDARGNPTRVTDAEGGVTVLTYDARGLVRTVTSPRAGAGDPAPFTVTFTYNDAGQVLTRTTGLPSVETFAYDAAGRQITATDANGHTTTFTHDALDRVLTVTDAAGRTATRTYDAIGDVIATTDVLGRTTRYGYDVKQQLVSTTFADGTLRAAAYDPLGNRTAAADELGRRTGTALDARNRPVAAVGEDGSVTTTAYDGGGRVLAVADANGHATTFAYDVLGRLVTTTDALGGVTARGYGAEGWLASVTDPMGRPTTYGYDRLGRLTSATDGLGHATTYGYDADGNRTSTTDPLGHTATAAYDVLGRRTAATDAAGRTTRFGYDPAGNVVSVTDPAGNVTTFGFDALDRTTRATDALGAARTYAYDAAGNLLTYTDRDGRVTTYAYDARDRRTAERWLGAGGGTVRTIRTGYDLAGQVVSAADPDSVTAWAYDDLGRLTTADGRGTPGLPRVVQTYARDAAGNVRTVTTTLDGAAADVEVRAYDAVNRLTRVSRSGMSAAFTYDAAGAFDTVTRSAGGYLLTAATYSYDAAGRLTGLAYSHGTAYGWVLDAASRATTETSPDGTATFGYDASNQLLSAARSGQPTELFDYDANGNRTGASYQTGADNRLLADGTYTYAYDAEGNRTLRTAAATGATTRYTWDHRNRLTAVTDYTPAGVAARTVAYAYDTADRLIARTETTPGAAPATRVERYVHDGDHVALAFDAAGDLEHRYLFGPYVDQALTAEDAAGRVTALVTDRQGSVREVVDVVASLTGVPADRVRYDAFGGVASETDPAAGPAFGNAGRPADDATGLSNNRARWYDPAPGRFVSPDPSSFAGGDPNLYRYAGNDPVNATDPSGLQWKNLGRDLTQWYRQTVTDDRYLKIGLDASRGGTLGVVEGHAGNEGGILINLTDFRKSRTYSTFYTGGGYGVGVEGGAAIALALGLPRQTDFTTQPEHSNYVQASAAAGAGISVVKDWNATSQNLNIGVVGGAGVSSTSGETISTTTYSRPVGEWAMDQFHMGVRLLVIRGVQRLLDPHYPL